MTTETAGPAGGPMARRLAARAVRLTEAMGQTRISHGADATDLTTPVTEAAPAHVRKAARDALARGETHYTSRPGIPELRGAIARQLTADGFPAAADGVVITNGGAEGLYIVLQALVERGTRVVTPDPLLPNVAAMISFIGGDRISVPSTAADGFRSTAATLLAEVSEGTVVLLASPSPVTGVAMTPAETRALAAGVADRGGTLVLDRSLAPAAHDPATVAFGAPEHGDAVVVVGSFSSGYGLDGWRVGYFSAAGAAFKRMQGLKQAMSICTTAVSQFAALAALDDVGGWLGQRRAAMTADVRSAADVLAGAGLPVVTPDAGPALLVDTRALGADDVAIAARLAEVAGVTVQAGSLFGTTTEGYVRIVTGGAARQTAIDRIAAVAGADAGTAPGTGVEA